MADTITNKKDMPVWDTSGSHSLSGERGLLTMAKFFTIKD
jgi:hypothetical protein